jgi:hypothetical protein
MSLRAVGNQNIFEVDVSGLSNPEKAAIYFERAKLVIEHALNDPDERQLAFRGKKFSRAYLCNKVGCGPAVTTQNPRIADLLSNTDRLLAGASETASQTRRLPGQQTAEEKALREQLNDANRQLQVATAEIADLRRKLRECGYREAVLADHGLLPW